MLISINVRVGQLIFGISKVRKDFMTGRIDFVVVMGQEVGSCICYVAKRTESGDGVDPCSDSRRGSGLPVFNRSISFQGGSGIATVPGDASSEDVATDGEVCASDEVAGVRILLDEIGLDLMGRD